MDTRQLNKEDIFKLEQVEIKAWEDIYLAADHELAEKCGIRVSNDNSVLISIASQSDVLALNRCLGLGLEPPVIRSDIEKIISTYREAGVSRFFVQLNSLITDSAIPDLLIDCGFEHYNNWVKLYRDVQPVSGVKSDLRVEKISQQQANDFARIVGHCFDWDEQLQPWLASIVGREGWHIYIAYDNATPAATGGFYRHEESVWIDFAATLEEYRGRGAQSALLKRRIDDIIAMGCKHIVVETAEQTAEKEAPSYRNMIRYGFTEAYTRPNFIYKF